MIPSTRGAAIGNRGFIALAITVFLVLFLSGFVPAIHQGMSLYLALTPIALAPHRAARGAHVTAAAPSGDAFPAQAGGHHEPLIGWPSTALPQ